MTTNLICGFAVFSLFTKQRKSLTQAPHLYSLWVN